MTLKSFLPLMGGLVMTLLLRGTSCAAFLVKEVPIDRAGTAVTVAVSTSAWTKSNTTASRLENRAAYRVTNPASNTAAMYAICHESAPAEAITVKINEIAKGSNMTIPCGPAMNLYLLSIHTASENANVWEIGQ